MNNLRQETEHIPTLEEIENVFIQLLQEQNYETVRKLEDKQGIYLLDIKISKKNGYNEYSYMRKGKYPEGQVSVTAIYVTFFNKSGIPEGGNSVAKFINNKWALTP